MKKLLIAVVSLVLFFGCSQKEVVVKKRVEYLQNAPTWVKQNLFRQGYIFEKSRSAVGDFNQKRDAAFFDAKRKIVKSINAKLDTFFTKHSIKDKSLKENILKDIQKEVGLYDLYESSLKKVYVLAYLKKDSVKKIVDKHFGKIKNSTYAKYIAAKKNGELESLF